MTDKTTTNDTDTTNEDVSGLKAKNAELVGKLKTATSSVATLQSRLEALEAAQADAADSTKTEVEKAEAKLNRQIAKLEADLKARDSRLGELLIDNAIKDAITTNNVLPQFAKAVEAMLRAGAKIENGEAISADGQSLADANAAFFKSPDAKHFVEAPRNSGGGAQGSSAQGAKWSKAPVTGTEMMKWAEEAVADPATYNAQARAWGRPDLEV